MKCCIFLYIDLGFWFLGLREMWDEYNINKWGGGCPSQRCTSRWAPWCNQCAQVKQDTQAHQIHYNEASDEPEAAHLPLAPPRMHRVEVRTGFRNSHLIPAKVSSVSSSLGKRAAGSKAQPKAKTDRAWDPTPIHPDKTLLHVYLVFSNIL